MNINDAKSGGEEMLAAVQKYFDEGYRLVTVTCIDEGEKVRLIYSFDRDLVPENLELGITREEAVPSISSIYTCAFLVENEIKELFGIQISNMSLDLGGHLYLTDGAGEAPMARKTAAAGKEVL